MTQVEAIGMLDDPGAFDPPLHSGQSASIGLLARDLHRLLHQAFEERVRHLGLPGASTRYLAIIREWGSATPSDLSAYFGVRSPTTLASLRTLEAKRYVRHTRDAKDGRRSNYTLTPKGAAFEANVRQIFREVEEEALAKLTADEVTQFRRLVGEIRLSLKRLLEDGTDTT